ncbi:1-acylglycerol-3-phosphate O-acyltransferase [Dissophora globulifera]|uniref:1-acyl-sn-glycerol-3-phosphate acyltransferase n=1 Tax=Dissophora globulifera TaxID=979702 RepID=A0A9P6RDS1_9FUNG|nr:1-acylglycerol-3-phosphate O-acyltransferase [Dissophora globulifera]
MSIESMLDALTDSLHPVLYFLDSGKAWLDSVLCTFPGKLVLATIFYLALPRILSVAPRQVQFAAKYLFFGTAALFMSAVGCFISVGCALLDKKHLVIHISTKIFLMIIEKPLDIKFHVKNEERLKITPAIVVCNHQSTLDVAVIGRIYPIHCSIMAKRELRYVPILGTFMKLSNVVFVNRKNHKQALQTSAYAIGYMKKNNSGMWIFPEGTRSHSEKAELLPFKKGAFHLAIQSGEPIIPVVTQNYSHVYSSKRRYFPGGEIEIRVLEPIPTTGLTVDDVESLLERTRTAMLESLKDMDMNQATLSSTKHFKTEQLPVPLQDMGGVEDHCEVLKKRKTLRA